MVQSPGPVYVLGVGMTKFIKPRGKVDCMFLLGINGLSWTMANYFINRH